MPQPPPFSDIKRILLVKLKHIGDVLLATPCIRALHEAFSAARISALVNDETRPMLLDHPLLEELIHFPRSSITAARWSRIPRELAFARSLRRRGFDMVVDLTSGDRAAWLGRLSGARYRIAYDPQGRGFLGKSLFYTHLAPAPADPDLHQVRKNLGLLEYFGVSFSEPCLELHTSDGERLAADQALRSFGLLNGSSPGGEAGRASFVVVHPTSRWLFKCWDDLRFARLVDWIQEECACAVIITCGPDPREIERARGILDACATAPRRLLGALNLREWAGLVRRARLFVGVDSAPMHIAASQGTPSVALFGPTGFQNWRPWAVRHAVLAHDCPCSRDRKPHCDWQRVRACMATITLEEAKAAVRSMLADFREESRSAGRRTEHASRVCSPSLDPISMGWL